jgi:hypothetical protein
MSQEGRAPHPFVQMILILIVGRRVDQFWRLPGRERGQQTALDGGVVDRIQGLRGVQGQRAETDVLPELLRQQAGGPGRVRRSALGAVIR